MQRILAYVMLLVFTLPLVAATTFSGRLVVLPNWTHQKTTGASSLTETFSDLLSWTHTSGTNANQMNTIVVESGTLTNSQAATIDLTSATDGFGDPITFASVRFLAVAADADNLDPIAVGSDDAEAFQWTGTGTNGTVHVRPGGLLMMVAPDATGYAVGTNGNLVVSNTGTNSVTYEVYVGGAK